MTTVVLGMLFALVLALGVVALVAVPARREGRELLTPQGEQLVQTARERTAEVATAALDKTVEVAGAALEKTVEVAEATRERVAERLTASTPDAPREGSQLDGLPPGVDPGIDPGVDQARPAEVDVRGAGATAAVQRPAPDRPGGEGDSS